MHFTDKQHRFLPHTEMPRGQRFHFVLGLGGCFLSLKLHTWSDHKIERLKERLLGNLGCMVPAASAQL
jgi:hypothetical protein